MNKSIIFTYIAGLYFCLPILNAQSSGDFYTKMDAGDVWSDAVYGTPNNGSFDNQNAVIETFGGSNSGAFYGVGTNSSINNASINIFEGIIASSVYAGGKDSTVKGDASVYVNILADSSAVNGNVSGGGMAVSGTPIVYGNTNVVVDNIFSTDGGAHCIIGGGYSAITKGSSSVTFNNGTINKIIGGDMNGGYSENGSNVFVKGGSVSTIVGGNDYEGNATFGDKNTAGAVNISISGGNVGQIRGGCNSSVDPEVEGFIGSFGVKSVAINISGNAVVGSGSADAIRGGGGSYCSVKDMVSIDVSENAVLNGTIFAGARSGASEGSAKINIKGGTINGSIYAGSSNSSAFVEGDTAVIISGGSITGDVYAGGKGDTVKGNTSVTILGENVVSGSIHGGGSTGYIVNGTKTLNVGNSTQSYTGNVNATDFDNININSASNATFAGDINNVDLNVNNAGLNADSLNVSSGKSFSASGNSTLNITNGININRKVSASS